MLIFMHRQLHQSIYQLHHQLHYCIFSCTGYLFFHFAYKGTKNGRYVRQLHHFQIYPFQNLYVFFHFSYDDTIFLNPDDIVFPFMHDFSSYALSSFSLLHPHLCINTHIFIGRRCFQSI